MNRALLATALWAITSPVLATTPLPLVPSASVPSFPQQLQSSDTLKVWSLWDVVLSPSSHVCTDSGSVLTTVGCSSGSGPSTNQNTRGIVVTFDGGGTALTAAAVPRTIPIPVTCTITSWGIDADQSGSIVFTVTKSAAGTYPPTASIVGSQPPSLSSSSSTNGFTAQSGWTTSVTAGDHIRVGIASVATITSVTLVIPCVATS